MILNDIIIRRNDVVFAGGNKNGILHRNSIYLVNFSYGFTWCSIGNSINIILL